MPFQQVDPKYFDFASRFMQGQQQARENKMQDQAVERQNALLKLETEQGARQATTFNNAEADRSKKLSDESAFQNALVTGDRDTILRFNPEMAKQMDAEAAKWASDGIGVLMSVKDDPAQFQQVAQQLAADPRAKWLGVVLGDITPDSVATLAAKIGGGLPGTQWKDDTRGGRRGQTEIATNKFDEYSQGNGGYGSGQAPSDQRLYEWLSNQSPEDQQAFLEMRRGYAGPEGARDLEAARHQGRAVGDAQGERDVTFEGDLAKIDDEIARNKRLLEDFKAGKYQTGYVAGLLPNYRTASQDLAREQGKDVLGAISSATFGALSEGEREYLRTLGISESNTEESNINLLTRRGIELKRARDRLAGRKSLVPSGPTSPGKAGNSPEVDFSQLPP